MSAPMPPIAAARGPAAASTGGGQRWADLLPRVLSAIVMTALALGTALVGGSLFALFWLFAAIAVQWEWQCLIGAERLILRFVAGCAGLVSAVWFAAAGQVQFALLSVVAGMVGSSLAGSGRRGMAALGVGYAGALAVSVTVLRGSSAGLLAIVWLFAVVWGTDVMAYFGGRLIGGPKLSRRFSPRKTWSGFLVGISAGALLGVCVAPAGSHAVALLLVGVAAGAVAQVGDIGESALKRRYGVKDSSHLIPGHGGVMDRLDGFIAAAVFALVLGSARAGFGAAGLGLLQWP